MSEITVRNRQELDSAMKNKIDVIIVEGELAKKLKQAKKISKLSKAGLAILTATIGAAAIAAPVTGGLSFFAAAPVAAITGVEIAAIITASALGIALVIAVFKEYEEISFDNGKLKMKRKRG